MSRTILGFLFAFFPAIAFSLPPTDLLATPPESWKQLEVRPLNNLIEEAVAARSDWPISPLEIAIRLTGGDAEVRELVIWEKKNRGEGADQVTVACVRDGLLDDSVRGVWHEIVLLHQPDSTWRVGSAKAAYRCWRSSDSVAFGDFDCP